MCHIMSQTDQFLLLWSKLMVELLDECCGVALHEPDQMGNAYRALKQVVVNVLQKLPHDIAAEVDSLTLGDSKPSILVSRMVAITGVDEDSLLLKPKFLGKLLAVLRLHLADRARNLHKITDMVDPLCKEV
jgi:hypothetical protein